MDQTQPTDNQILDQSANDDLQKAIDDITNTTKDDPVFSDPVAAPSLVAPNEGQGVMDSVGPLSTAPADEKQDVSEHETATTNMPNLGGAPAPTPIDIPASSLDDGVLPMPNEKENNQDDYQANPEEKTIQDETRQDLSGDSEQTMDGLVMPKEQSIANSNDTINDDMSMRQVKEAALRDLIPLLGHLEMNPVQKFDLYRNIFEQLKDYTVLNPAYRAASEIPDEKSRAKALLYLIEAIDKM